MRSWVVLAMGIAVTACTPATKSGGAIVDTEGDESDGSEAGDSAPSEEGPSGGDSMEGPGDESDTEGPAGCGAGPTCGNGIVEALEECEGEQDCNGCSSTEAPTVLIDGADGESRPIAVGRDGSVLALTRSFESEYTLRRYDAGGEEAWSEVRTDETTIVTLALDGAGNAYAAGQLQLDPPESDRAAWITAWDGAGAPIWTFTSAELGFFIDVDVANDRVAAAGGHGTGAGEAARLQVFDVEGASQWTVVEDGLGAFTSVAIVGGDLVVTGAAGGFDTTLTRYDDTGAQLWSVDLPGGETRVYGLIADGSDGTWTYGTAGLVPLVVHHDGEGNEIATYDCIGGMNGRIDSGAVDGDGRLALAMTVELLVDEVTYSQAWFPVLASDAVASAVMFGDPDTGNGAGGSVVGWRADGTLVVGWTEFQEEGGPGPTRVLLLPP